MEHCLYAVLCTFLQSQSQQQVERILGRTGSVAMLYKILHILNVVNPHLSDGTILSLTGFPRSPSRNFFLRVRKTTDTKKIPWSVGDNRSDTLLLRHGSLLPLLNKHFPCHQTSQPTSTKNARHDETKSTFQHTGSWILEYKLPTNKEHPVIAGRSSTQALDELTSTVTRRRKPFRRITITSCPPNASYIHKV